MKCSHLFNLLDARGAISVSERVGYVLRVRTLAKTVAEAYIKMLEKRIIKRTKKNNIKNALLEIGTEEIPASYIEPALKQMEEIASKSLNTAGLKYDAIRTYATPRRLVLMIDGLEDKSPDRMEEVLGPSLKAAKDADGKFTQAALGFANKNGVKPEKLSTKVTEKGEYLCFLKKIKGEKTEKLLAVIFPEIIKGISFRKQWFGRKYVQICKTYKKYHCSL